MKTYKLNEYVTKYRFGSPIFTDAVVTEGSFVEKGEIKYVDTQETDEIKLTYKMGADDIVLGLGENVRGINKRGWQYISFCSDDSNHTPNKKSLYGAHNFIIIDGLEHFGMFIDYPGKVTYDIGYSTRDELVISIEGTDADIYIIEGISSKDIVRAFHGIIGKSYVPPKWAFGFQQSRWSYTDAKEVEALADGFINNDMPCDAIYLDIDYMENFKDFTIDDNRFPDFKAFVSKIKAKGFRLIPIIDAGVKIEDGYEVYEEGVANNYFCTDEKGDPFVAAVWPGKVHFPDFLNNAARQWFGTKYRVLTDCGIEGFWNDMNEPAIFYSDKGLKKAIEEAKDSEGKNLDVYSFFRLRDAFGQISNNITDYKSFYHNLDGRIVNNYSVHNLYGCMMTKSADGGLQTIAPNKRFLLFSRSSYIGAHRYSGIWTGDNHSWWEHLLLNIKMIPSINMCGFLYSGADTGGFGEDCSAELLIRWMQFSLFTPLFRNHSSFGTRRQEPFDFDEETAYVLKKALWFRYALIPYIYSEYMKAAASGFVYISPLLFEYSDEMSRRVEDQLLVGESIMIAPMYTENARGRYIWLPEPMLLWKVNDYRERKYEVLGTGHHYIDVDYDEIPLFVRKNKLMVFGTHGSNADNIKVDELHVVGFLEDHASYIYYDDDGYTKDYEQGKCSQIAISIKRNGDKLDISINNQGNKQVKRISFEIVDTAGKIVFETLEIDQI